MAYWLVQAVLHNLNPLCLRKGVDWGWRSTTPSQDNDNYVLLLNPFCKSLGCNIALIRKGGVLSWRCPAEAPSTERYYNLSLVRCVVQAGGVDP